VTGHSDGRGESATAACPSDPLYFSGGARSAGRATLG
jgi:hypothetical protein